jgi:hypothetical protein
MCRLGYFCTNVTPVDLILVVVALVGEVFRGDWLCTETLCQIHLTGTPEHKSRIL